MTDNDTMWRKSSYSDGSGGQCVEVGQNNGVLIRDTKDNGTGPVLRLAVRDWTGFLRSLKA